MITILEKYEHNVDFHQIVDFVEASHIRYTLTITPTVYVSHIRQFWSTARIETTDEGTKILATVDDAELFENLALMGYNILRNQKFSFQNVIMEYLLKISKKACILKLKRRYFEDYCSDILYAVSIKEDTAYPCLEERFPLLSQRDAPAEEVCTADEVKGEGSGTPTEPHHTPSPEAEQSPYTAPSLPSQPTETTKLIPTITPSEIPTLRQYSRRARIAQHQTKMATKIATQDLEITSLKTRIKLLEDKDGGGAAPSGGGAAPSGEDDTIKGRSLKTGEEADVEISTERGTREIKEQLAREDQRRDEQIARNAEITRIHAEKELQMLIDGLDRNNETIAKYLQEYEQFVADLSIGEKIDMINELVKYHDHYAKVLKYQSQQRKPLFKKQQREFYMSIEDFVPVASKEEGERVKRKGLRLEHESAKKMKTSEEVSKEDLKEMMQLVPVEEVYIESLQVKHLIIDWEIYSEGQRTYWKIIRLGGHTDVYQFFVDMLKHFDREDLT
uniref:Xylulose kinase-1 n=1 Tax=Tanacetum cinerariifolium TaxID=118510 RepID=A0A699HY90_TANCI|nr:hypothetical protein [Tanacetum cinerariifolium]